MKLFKGAEVQINSNTILNDEIDHLRHADEGRRRRRNTKREVLQNGGVLTVELGRRLQEEKANSRTRKAKKRTVRAANKAKTNTQAGQTTGGDGEVTFVNFGVDSFIN